MDSYSPNNQAGLAGRLARYFLFLATLLLLVMTPLLVYTSFKAQRDALRQAQQATAEKVALTVTQLIEDLLQDFQRDARFLQGLAKMEQQTILENLLESHSNVAEMAIFDSTGIKLNEASRYWITASALQGNFENAQTEQFSALDGNPFISQVYIGVAMGSDENKPFIIMAVPLRDGDGGITGMLSASVNLNYMWEIVTQSQIGDKGYVYVIDRSGNLIAHPDPYLVSLQLEVDDFPELQDVISGVETVDQREYQGLSFQQVVGSLIFIKSLQWWVIVELPVSEAYSSIRNLFWLSCGLFLLGLGLAFLAGRYLAAQIVKPIQELREGAELVGGGNLAYVFKVETQDEIGVLAKTFNSMTRQLSKLINSQEEEIAERRRVENELEEQHKQLEELVGELTVAKEEAEMANAFKSEFLARMSHEIRTPLNAVTGLTNIVLKSELTSEQRDYLNKVQIAGNNLLEVINDILDFSKVEAGRLELILAPFDLDEMLEQLADLFSNRVSEKDLELIFAIAPKVPRQLVGDAGRLNQVLTNLIENAVKFTDEGELVVSVELAVNNKTKDGQKAIRFQVSDTGSGIAPEVLPYLFDPFTQADTSLTRKHEGTGLGLAICRRLVELMGGKITAVSSPGLGSTFTFTLEMEIQKEVKSRLITPLDLHGIKTLVVDDSETARKVMVDLLESFTFNVSAVDSGDKAIEEVKEAIADEPYQLVLMDWKMPGMDGLEAARSIRELNYQPTENVNQEPQPPIIIMVTAYGLELLEGSLETSVLDSSLLKPIKPSQLFNTIMELFGRKEATVPRIKRKNAINFEHLSNRRVLVVEDSELNRDVTVSLLEEAGLQVDVAENGQVAVDTVTESPKDYYEALFMDIQMPVMDGYEATRHIREWESLVQDGLIVASTKRLPIIALTAHALKGEKERCLRADMDDYLSKPLNEQDLYRMLVKWIDPKTEEPDTEIQPHPLEASGAADGETALDVEGALKRLGGRRKLYYKVLRKFEAKSAEAHSTISGLLSSHDTEAALLMAHTVKGSAATIGATDLSQLAADLETAIRDNNTDIYELLNVFETELEKTLRVARQLSDAEPEG